MNSRYFRVETKGTKSSALGAPSSLFVYSLIYNGGGVMADNPIVLRGGVG